MRKMLMMALWAMVVLAAVSSPAADLGARTRGVVEKADWRPAIQTSTFNRMTLFETLDAMKRLNVVYACVTNVEIYPGQRLGGGLTGAFDPSMNAVTRQKVREKLAANGIGLVNYGVVTPRSAPEWKTLFEFAKEMRIETIVSEPEQKDLEMIDTLCGEYGINVALHNGPKPSNYSNPDILLAACKDRSKRIGACADTGNWVRSGLIPLICLKQLEGKIICLHFKDEKMPGKLDVPWGTGDSDAIGMLRELKRIGFEGVFSIEFDKYSGDLMAHVKKCSDFLNRCARMSQTDLDAFKKGDLTTVSERNNVNPVRYQMTRDTKPAGKTKKH